MKLTRIQKDALRLISRPGASLWANGYRSVFNDTEKYDAYAIPAIHSSTMRSLEKKGLVEKSGVFLTESGKAIAESLKKEES